MPMPEPTEIASLLLTLDLAGTAVFAVSGAAVGVKHRLDVFGVCVLAFVAGNAGGMLRDVLIGAILPAAFVGWKHVTISLLAGVITFIWHPRLERLHIPILISMPLAWDYFRFLVRRRHWPSERIHWLRHCSGC